MISGPIHEPVTSAGRLEETTVGGIEVDAVVTEGVIGIVEEIEGVDNVDVVSG